MLLVDLRRHVLFADEKALDLQDLESSTEDQTPHDGDQVFNCVIVRGARFHGLDDLAAPKARPIGALFLTLREQERTRWATTREVQGHVVTVLDFPGVAERDDDLAPELPLGEPLHAAKGLVVTQTPATEHLAGVSDPLDGMRSARPHFLLMIASVADTT